MCAFTLSLNSANSSFRVRRTSSSSSSSLSGITGGTMREHTRQTCIGSSFKILTTSLCVSPMRGIPFTCQEDTLYIYICIYLYIFFLIQIFLWSVIGWVMLLAFEKYLIKHSCGDCQRLKMQCKFFFERYCTFVSVLWLCGYECSWLNLPESPKTWYFQWYFSVGYRGTISSREHQATERTMKVATKPSEAHLKTETNNGYAALLSSEGDQRVELRHRCRLYTKDMIRTAASLQPFLYSEQSYCTLSKGSSGCSLWWVICVGAWTCPVEGEEGKLFPLQYKRKCTEAHILTPTFLWLDCFLLPLGKKMHTAFEIVWRLLKSTKLYCKV